MQFIFWHNDAGCIRKNDLVVFFRHDGFDTVTGGLHFWRYNSQLLSHQRIQQGAFARIGPSEYVYKTSLH